MVGFEWLKNTPPPMEIEGMMMTAAASSLGGGLKKAMMIEAAKKELEMLETQQPNKFNHLKMEINRFIISLIDDEEVVVQYPLNFNTAAGTGTGTGTVSVSSPAKTQASSTCMKKKKRKNNKCEELQGLMLPVVICLPSQEETETETAVMTGAEEDDFVIAANEKHKIRKKEDNIDEVIKRAQACLEKIQHFKTNNFYS